MVNNSFQDSLSKICHGTEEVTFTTTEKSIDIDYSKAHFTKIPTLLISVERFGYPAVTFAKADYNNTTLEKARIIYVTTNAGTPNIGRIHWIAIE